MDVRDLVKSSANITASSNYSPTRAKSFKVKTSGIDFAQYVRTVKAYALAGMAFSDIANAGDLLGDEVQRQEIDLPLQETWQEKAGEVAEDESKILAWQARGEKESIIRQLPTPGLITRQELVVVSQEDTIDVLEGINVVNSDKNPFLKAKPIEFNKLPRSKLRGIPSGKFFSNHSSLQQSCEVLWFKNKPATAIKGD